MKVRFGKIKRLSSLHCPSQASVEKQAFSMPNKEICQLCIIVEKRGKYLNLALEQTTNVKI